MITDIAMANQSLRRVDTLIILHLFRFKRSVLILSCAIFLLAVLCQFPPSTSIAIFSDGNARSILNLSNANEGIGSHPSLFNILAIADSYLLIFAFLCFPFALLQRSSCERFFPVMIARLAAEFRIRSSYVLLLIFICMDSDGVCRGMPYKRNQRNITLGETPRSFTMSCAVPFLYIFNNHSRGGLDILSVPIGWNINQISPNCNMNGTRSFAPYMGEL